MLNKMSKFYKVYLIVVASLVSLLFIGSIVLWMFLGAFEETRPKYVADQIFAKYFDLQNITSKLVMAATTSATMVAQTTRWDSGVVATPQTPVHSSPLSVSALMVVLGITP